MREVETRRDNTALRSQGQWPSRPIKGGGEGIQTPGAGETVGLLHIRCRRDKMDYGAIWRSTHACTVL